jgi:hypothetical protein
MLPEARTLSREDYPDQAGWVDRLLRPLNSFMAQVATSFRKALVEGENYWLDSFSFDTAALVSSTFPLVRSIRGVRPRSCLLAYIKDETLGTSFASAPFITWELAGNSVKIINITGLGALTRYSITLEFKG